MLVGCKRSPDLWDILIIGGGATGLGAAVDAASRGFRTLLLERNDFAKGTSSRSTKLIHGGLRYLKQGNIALVVEALKERGILSQNAPHLVSHLPFLVPSYHWWEGPFYGIGIKIYDLLAGKLGFEPSQLLSREEVLTRLPTLEPRALRGGTIYYDGQFDDARLAIALARTAADQGATLVNYMTVTGLIKEKEIVAGVRAVDGETGEEYVLRAKAVINATGVFSDQVRKLDHASSRALIQPSQGVHLVLDRSFLPSDTAILIPATEDGRVLFFVPWHRHLLVGTTDTPVSSPTFEPVPLSTEIDFLLHYAGRYLTRKPGRSDVLAAFAGLRPLIQTGRSTTAALSRDHALFVSESGLITITGGKWTTYRKMGQDAIDKAIIVGHLPQKQCETESLRLHGYRVGKHTLDSWSCYGSDAEALDALCQENQQWRNLLHPRLPYTWAEVIWGVRFEMALTVEDVLARRTRALFLDARAAIEVAPAVAAIIAQERGLSPQWQKEQINAFASVASGYCVANG
jgi:glycerol-3-phosphate dehydrogenase